MNAPGGDDLATTIRNATRDAATRALTGFGEATALALGDAASGGLIRDHASHGAGAVADSLIASFATDLLGRVVTEVDAHGIDVTGVHVTTQLARFASGEAVRSPIDALSLERTFPFAFGGIGAIDASGALTLHTSCKLDAATGSVKTVTSARIKLEVAWSSEPAHPGAGPTS